jgi:hypothetical protein
MKNENLIRSTEYSVKVKNIDLTKDDIADLSINIVYDFIEQGICPTYDDVVNGTFKYPEEDEEIHFQYQDIIREHLEKLFKIK